MKNFSDISSNLKTSKDCWIDEFVEKSGLPKELVTDMYGKVSNDILKTPLVDCESLDVKDIDIEFLDNAAEKDIMVFLNSTIPVLYAKDSNRFKNICSGVINIKQLSKTLNESINDTVTRTIPIVIPPGIKNELSFYGDLRTILARNNKRWGVNNHLDNVYQTILKYLDDEIEYLTTKDNLYQTNVNFEKELLEQLLNGDLNVMYRDISVLRNLCPDLQLLVFDLSGIINNTVKNIKYNKFVNVQTFNEFKRAYQQIHTKLLSSEKDSFVFADGNDILNNYFSLRALLDMVYIIKSCSVDFNIKLRPYINNFVTKSFELLASYQRIMRHGS